MQFLLYWAVKCQGCANVCRRWRFGHDETLRIVLLLRDLRFAARFLATTDTSSSSSTKNAQCSLSLSFFFSFSYSFGLFVTSACLIQTRSCYFCLLQVDLCLSKPWSLLQIFSTAYLSLFPFLSFHSIDSKAFVRLVWIRTFLWQIEEIEERDSSFNLTNSAIQASFWLTNTE